MRALIPAIIVIPVLFFARPVWACDDDDNDSDDDSDDVAEVEAPEPPEPPAPWVADTFQVPNFTVDFHYDIDVRWKDHTDDDRSQAVDLVRSKIDDLRQQLDSIQSQLDNNNF
jgi:hypothetical protein